MFKTKVDVLIPTYSRPMSLAITLTSLCSQIFKNFRVLISDQTETSNPLENPEIVSIIRILKTQGRDVICFKHLPRLGMAEQRQFLLDQSESTYVLYLDDDLVLEKDIISRLVLAIEEEKCGFVGAAPIGLSYINDIRPQEQKIEFWERKVIPETIIPKQEKWERYRLHNAANIFHVQKKLNLNPLHQKKYHVAWIGGCILYNTEKLKQTGGFNFWKTLPKDHCGEDVFVQIRVMRRFGGCGIIPSGVYHLELPTTIQNREVNAPMVLNDG